MISSLSATALALVLISPQPPVVAAGPAAADAEATGSETTGSLYHPVHLTVDTAKLLGEQEANLVDETKAEVVRNVTTFLEKHLKVVAANDPDAVEIVVSLGWVNYKKSIYDVTVDATRPGGSTHTMSFEILGDHVGIIEHLEGDTSKILSWAERDPNANPAVVSPPPGEPGKDGENGGATQQQPSDRKLHALGWTGVALGVVGVGLGVTGAVLLPQKTTSVSFDGNGVGAREEPKFSRALTISLIAGGSLLAVTGVALIITDVVRTRRASRRSSVSVSPMLNAHQAGLGLTGSF